MISRAYSVIETEDIQSPLQLGYVWQYKHLISGFRHCSHNIQIIFNIITVLVPDV